MHDGMTKVWDPFVRVFHWSLVIAFFVAYFTEPEDSGLALHVWAGYFVGGIVVLRVIWGFVGTGHARFSDFAFGPFHALAYLRDLVRGRSKRYLGHSPAGAWMVYLLLLALTATVLTGMTVLATEKGQGPLAPFVSSASVRATPAMDRRGAEERAAASEDTDEPGEGLAEEMHETLANFVLILVVLHIFGVVVASVSHRENLVRAMVTGKKPTDRPTAPATIPQPASHGGEPR
jgi:cytochrome b